MTNELESQILELYHQGKKNRVIARELSIHHNTVRYWLNKNELRANYFGQPIEMVDDENACCSKCKKVLPVDNFQFGRKSKDYEYRFSYCNDCRKKQCYLNLNSDIDKFLVDKYHRLVNRCKKFSIICVLTKEEFIEQYHKQKGLCFYTDEPMVCEVGAGKSRNSASVDKIIPDKGYVSGNFVFAINKVNTCKNDLSINDIQKWMPKWYIRIQNHLNIEK